jgi:ABC-2 type transport system permease protein
MNTMKWLVRREYWENKGGFVWAPIVVGALAIVFAIVATIIGTMILQGEHVVHMNSELSEKPEAIGAAGDMLMLAGVGLTSAVLSFVLFFYSLGSLYDDRRDRSILFWKSMPVSDVEMVLSKTAWAFVLAPVLALGIGLALGLVFTLIAMLGSLFTGVSGAGAMLLEAHPFKIIGMFVLALPVQMLWSLPAIGWLMLCSAWARRLPFLWATIVPFLTAIMISFTDLFPGIEIAHDKVWYTLVSRGLMSVVPGSWFPTISDNIQNVHRPEDMFANMDLLVSWQVLGHADVWIGAVLGVAMIVAATRLRRWRDEG